MFFASAPENKGKICDVCGGNYADCIVLPENRSDSSEMRGGNGAGYNHADSFLERMLKTTFLLSFLTAIIH